MSTIYGLLKLRVICLLTELVRGMGLFLVWCHTLLCMHFYKGPMQCKSVCDVKQGIDPCPFLAQSWNRWWLDFVTFAAYKMSIFGWKRRKTAQYVSNRCKELFQRKEYFGVRCTLSSYYPFLRGWLFNRGWTVKLFVETQLPCFAISLSLNPALTLLSADRVVFFIEWIKSS